MAQQYIFISQGLSTFMFVSPSCVNLESEVGLWARWNTLPNLHQWILQQLFLHSHFLASATGSTGWGSGLKDRVSSSLLIFWVTQCGNYNFPQWVKLELKRKVGFQVAGAGLGHCRGRKSWEVTERAWIPLLFMVLVFMIIILRQNTWKKHKFFQQYSNVLHTKKI